MYTVAEQVTKYHPDKYADQISDALFDEYRKLDKNSHCNIETFVQDTTVLIGGNVTSKGEVNHKHIVQRVANKLGYNVDTIIDKITQQSIEIYNTVQDKYAGDQGIMIGYATNETSSYLPYCQHAANELIHLIELDCERKGSRLKGDGKVVVTCDNNIITSITINVCSSFKSIHELQYYVNCRILNTFVNTHKTSSNLIININKGGLWSVGGPKADSGLTGRKLVCDNYGPQIPIGGGCYSGKDFTKVDRSASYIARYIATDIIKTTGEHDCIVKLGYNIGCEKPIFKQIITSTGYDLTNRINNYPINVPDIIYILNNTPNCFETVSEGCHFRPTCYGGINI